MKILVILNSLCIGGAENYTISLINQFILTGNHVKLIVLSNDISLKERLSSKVNISILPRKYKLDIKVLKELRREVNSSIYEAIISSYPEYLKLSLLFSNSNIITIYPLHSTILRSKKDVIFRKMLFKLKRKNEIFLTSIDSQTKYLREQYNLPDDFFAQILNGINTDYFTLPPVDFNGKLFLTQLGIPANNKVILMVAAFREEKRHVDALSAFKLLQASYPDVSFVCVGNNDYSSKQRLERFAKDNEIKNVTLLSASEAGEVRNYYWASDLFTLTSNKVETFSISALEALSCGIPCVLTNIGGAKDFISDMENGCLVEPNDFDSIKNGWLKILNNLLSFNKSELRNRIVLNYSIQKSASKYIELIKEKTL